MKSCEIDLLVGKISRLLNELAGMADEADSDIDLLVGKTNRVLNELATVAENSETSVGYFQGERDRAISRLNEIRSQNNQLKEEAMAESQVRASLEAKVARQAEELANSDRLKVIAAEAEEKAKDFKKRGELIAKLEEARSSLASAKAKMARQADEIVDLERNLKAENKELNDQIDEASKTVKDFSQQNANLRKDLKFYQELEEIRRKGTPPPLLVIDDSEYLKAVAEYLAIENKAVDRKAFANKHRLYVTRRFTDEIYTDIRNTLADLIQESVDMGGERPI